MAKSSMWSSKVLDPPKRHANSEQKADGEVGPHPSVNHPLHANNATSEVLADHEQIIVRQLHVGAAGEAILPFTISSHPEAASC